MTLSKYVNLIKVLENSTLIEKHLVNSKTHCVLEVTPESKIRTSDIPVPDTTKDGQWAYRWVERDGRHDKGKLIVIPRHRRTKLVLRSLIYQRLLYEKFDTADATILARILNHKPFDKDKLDILKSLFDNKSSILKVIEIFNIEEMSNESKYRLLEELGLKRPVDYKTFSNLVEELDRYTEYLEIKER